MLNPLPLTVLLALSVVNAPLLGVALPIVPGAAQELLRSVVALSVVLQVKPAPEVYVSAFEVALQLGMTKAVGDADEPVTFATTVFAACAASVVAATFPHAGALEAPVETIACPEVDPLELSN